jgi:hypothetical protein
MSTATMQTVDADRTSFVDIDMLTRDLDIELFVVTSHSHTICVFDPTT